MKKIQIIILSLLILAISGCAHAPKPPTQKSEPIVIDHGKVEYIPQNEIPKQITDFIYFLGEYNLNKTRDENEIETQLNKAFALISNPNKQELKEKYQNIQYVRTRTLKPINENKFSAELEFFNTDNTGEIRELIFEQDPSSKLNIVSDKPIPMPYVTKKITLSGGKSAKAVINNKNQRQIFLNEQLIEEIEPNQGYTVEIKDLKLSTNPDYFEYRKMGWEQEEIVYINIYTGEKHNSLP